MSEDVAVEAAEDTEATTQVADAQSNAAGANYYQPTAEDMDRQCRSQALLVAAGLRPPGHTRAGEVLEDAKLFHGFLRGDD